MARLLTQGQGTRTGERHYTLVCAHCGSCQADDGFMLDCPQQRADAHEHTEAPGHAQALLRTEYRLREFGPRGGSSGLARYRDWLPVRDGMADAGRSAVYRSTHLARAIGLPNLWIAFNGYWPERGADLPTASFKDFEANTVLARMPADRLVLTVASSGNTGAAFAWACSAQGVPCLLVVPGQGLHRLRFTAPLAYWVKIVVIDDGDYYDAINLAARLCELPGFRPEGGVRNVARRDGLGTVLLSAFEEMNSLPTHYVQAVGSGTGAIGVLEAARRLRGAGLADVGQGAALPKLVMCQNRPFMPIYTAWRAGRTALVPEPAAQVREAIAQSFADELGNRTPPYGVVGGVYDSLRDSAGDVRVAGKAATRAAMTSFAELEGIDIEPAAGVALACLREAALRSTIARTDVVLLNVTGGGRARLAADHRLVLARPSLRVGRAAADCPDTVKAIAELPWA
jgi:cysteate synthase